jgi:hypothetical protein
MNSDTITNLLTTFFVSKQSKKTPKTNKELNEIKNIKKNLEQDSDNLQLIIKKKELIEKDLDDYKQESTKKDSKKDSTKKDSTKKDSTKKDSKELIEKGLNQDSKELIEKDSKELIEKDSKELIEKGLNQDSKELIEKDSKELIEKDSKELIEKDSKELIEKELEYLKLNGKEFIKRNILLVNKNFKLNIMILSELLSKLSDNYKKYDDILNIICYQDNKKDFKKMLIENPQINFININFSKLKKIDIKNSEKRHILIIDYDYINDIEEVEKYFQSNILLIVLTSEYNNEISELMVNMREYKSTLLIHRIDNSKMLETRIFNKVILNNLDYSIKLNDYLEFNKKNIKNIVLQSGGLKILS